MDTTVTSGVHWIGELTRLSREDARVGKWAHVLLRRARWLQAKGQLTATIPAATPWQRMVMKQGERCEPLTTAHRDWLVAQATALRALSALKTDCVGSCAGAFLDWIIWFWTADACYPSTYAVRRDGIKYDPEGLWSTEEAQRELDKVRRNGLKVSKVVEHEHAVPKKAMIELIRTGKMQAGDVLSRFGHAVLVTRSEHQRLNQRFRDQMPCDWEPTSETADPFARYRRLEIGIWPPGQRRRA